MTTEDEARLAGIRERCKSPPWQEHDIGFLLRLLDVAHARIAQLDADYVQAQKDANVMIDEREAKVKRLEAMAHASVGECMKWCCEVLDDRNAMIGAAETRAAQAEADVKRLEAFIASIGQDSGVDFHDEIAHLRGEGPDPFAVPEVERWKKRAEAAEKSATDLKEQLNSNEASLDSALKACLAAEAEAGRIRGVMHADAIADWDFCPTCELAYHTPESATSRCPYCAVRKWEDREIRRASCCDENEQRAQKAELRLSQVENTIRAAIGRFEAVAREYRDQMFVWDEGGEVLSALHELLVDLGFEPEPRAPKKQRTEPTDYRVEARCWNDALQERFGAEGSTHCLTDAEVVDCIRVYGRADIDAGLIRFENTYD